MELPQALTFDDVLLVPQESNVLPTAVDTVTRFSRNVPLNIPLASAAMDSVTESKLAISIAHEGGIGVVHRNLSIEDQVHQVEMVKRSAHGVIRDPLTMTSSGTVGEARNLMQTHNISGLPIVDKEICVGIITRRDLKFQGGDKQPVSEVMTRELVTAKPDTSLAQARKILSSEKVEKLVLLDKNNSLAGLITMRDIRLDREYPQSAKDREGCLLVGAAIGPHDYDRAEALVAAGVDVLVIDTAHGHSENVINTVVELKKKDLVDVVAGNICVKDAAEALIAAGADGVKVGIGPGSICTTRVVAGVGMPQFSAILQVSEFCNEHNVPVIADGGIRHSGDAAKALAAGAECVMLGSLFAGVDESPGESFLYNGRTFKAVRGMGSLTAMVEGGKARYGQDSIDEQQKLVPEGIEGMVPARGPLAPFVYQFVGGIRSAMGYLGSKDLPMFRSRASFVQVTGAGVQENHPHDVRVTKEAPNYWKTD